MPLAQIMSSTFKKKRLLSSVIQFSFKIHRLTLMWNVQNSWKNLVAVFQDNLHKALKKRFIDSIIPVFKKTIKNLRNIIKQLTII